MVANYSCSSSFHPCTIRAWEDEVTSEAVRMALRGATFLFHAGIVKFWQRFMGKVSQQRNCLC